MGTNQLQIISGFFSFIVFVRGIITLLLLNKTLNRLHIPLSSKHCLDIDKKIYILIPVLREQTRIISTLDYMVKIFPAKNVSIIVITTQKEYEKSFTGKSTYDVVTNYIKDKKLNKKIALLDYPIKNGYMAHQLNYALNGLDNDSYLMIYNADSRPHPNTIKIFSQISHQYPDAEIFQQSAVFFKNFDDFDKHNLFTRNFLQTSAILQTRWTLTHEIPRLIRQSLTNNRLFINYANAHCVGHGLIIRTKLLKEIGGFPTDKAITEDLFLGYVLKALNFKIYPFPLLELADSPQSIRGLWNQKYVWFWGPLNYLKYYKFAVKKLHNHSLNKTKLIAYLVQGYISAIAWMTSGVIVLLSLLISLWLKDILLLIICLIALVVYGPLQFFIIGRQLPFLFQQSGFNHTKLSLIELLITSIMSFPVILFNSLPPYQTILVEIGNQVLGTEIKKPKTDE